MSASAMFVHREGVLLGADGELLPGAAAVVRRMNLAGVPVVALGNLDPTLAESVPERQTALAAALGEAELARDEYAIEDAGHVRRLPRPGMLLEACAELGVDLFASWFITADPEALKAAGQAGCAGAVLVGDAGDAPKLLGLRVMRARDLADAPRVMVPEDGGCWHEHG